MGPPKGTGQPSNASEADVEAPTPLPHVAPRPIPPGFHATGGYPPEVPVGVQKGGATPQGSAQLQTPVRIPSRSQEDVTPLAQFVLGGFAAVLAFIAAVVIGAAKQNVDAKGPGYTLSTTLTAVKSSQFQFFLAINVMACVYAAFSLGALASSRRAAVRTKQMLATYFTLADQAAVALMFAAVGCAAAISVRGKQGLEEDSHYVTSFCDSFDKFCKQVDGAVAMSALSAIAFLAVAFVGTVGLQARTL